MFNLAALKRIFFAAALAGALAGLLLTLVQQLQVSQLILKAEVYEDAAAAVAAPLADHSHAAAGHEPHEHAAWQPANGAERTVFTALANISLAVGFGLLLGAVIVLRGQVGGWRAGLLWGLGGYLVFFVAPSLGLPPEVPGTEAAPLGERQLWWLMAVVMTASGLFLLTFVKNWQARLLGVVFLGVPHLVGAPQLLLHSSTAPIELAHAFIYATAMANAVFWLALGGLMGFFYEKFA